MDIDFRWGGDPNIVLGVEAALVASIPIQVWFINNLDDILLKKLFFGFGLFFFNNKSLFSPFFAISNLGISFSLMSFVLYLLQLKDLQVFTVVRVIFQLAEEIPCVSAVVVALLAEVN